jgi:hypothetical protein
MAKGIPKAVVRPAPGAGTKVPKVSPSASGSTAGQKPAFSFEFADKNHVGSWCWPSQADAHKVLTALADFGQKTWSEIFAEQTGGRRRRRKHHYQEVSSICKEAQDRLAVLKHDEVFSDLFRFRLSGTERLWGYLQGGTFHVLWWDADHGVYPTDPN